MFAYCWNNPVIRSDEAGTDPLTQATADDTNPLDDYENFGRLPGGGGGVRGSVRNPWGRPGGTEHQSVIKDVKDWYKARGIATTTTEPYIRIEGGLKGGRYGDVGVYGGNNGQLRSIVQVGKVNANGTPISREMKAIYDYRNRPRRQDTHLHMPLYGETGSIYIIKTDIMYEVNDFIGKKPLIYNYYICRG